MQQNTADWLEWRKKGLGASDAPIIMGESQYKTPFQLWESKVLNKEEEPKSTFVADLGHKFETAIRADLLLEYGYSFDAQCAEHNELPWLRASLDGLNEDNRVFAEIKYVGKLKLEDVEVHKRVSFDHWIQMQHQFMVTGYEKGIYICYTLNEERNKIDKVASMMVEPDVNYIRDELFPKLKEFWECVQNQKEPELTDRDVREIKTEEALNLVNQLQGVMNVKAEAEKSIKALKGMISELTKENAKTKIGKLTVSKIYKKGNVDYSQINELDKVNLDEFRKVGTTYEKFTFSK